MSYVCDRANLTLDIYASMNLLFKVATLLLLVSVDVFVSLKSSLNQIRFISIFFRKKNFFFKVQLENLKSHPTLALLSLV